MMAAETGEVDMLERVARRACSPEPVDVDVDFRSINNTNGAGFSP